MTTTITYQYRICIREVLIPLSSEVNFVWNFCNDIVRRRDKESRFFTNESDLNELTKGSSKLLNINSQSIQAIYQELLKQIKKRKLVRFRTRKKKLGWIPFKGQTFKFLGNYSTYNGYKIRYWYHRPLPKDAVVTFPEYLEPTLSGEVGIDFGIKTIATLSTGTKIERENISSISNKNVLKNFSEFMCDFMIPIFSFIFYFELNFLFLSF